MQETMRLFISLDFNDEAIDYLSEYAKKIRKIDRSIRFTQSQNLHITLKFIGEKKSNILDDLTKSLDTISFRERVKIEINGYGFFPNHWKPRIFWAAIVKPVDILTGISKEIDSLLFKRMKIPMEKRDFVPHLTLGRLKEIKYKTIPEFPNPELSTELYPIRLKKSILTSEGPIYETLWEIQP